MKPKMQPFENESRMYPPGYYYQAVPPPGFEMNQGMMPMPQTNVVYNEYMHPSMMPMQTFSNKNMLDPTNPADSYQPEGKLIRAPFLLRNLSANFYCSFELQSRLSRQQKAQEPSQREKGLQEGKKHE